MLSWDYTYDEIQQIKFELATKEAFEDGKEEGEKQGLKKGLKQGQQQGLKQGAELLVKLINEGLSPEEALKKIKSTSKPIQ